MINLTCSKNNYDKNAECSEESIQNGKHAQTNHIQAPNSHESSITTQFSPEDTDVESFETFGKDVQGKLGSLFSMNWFENEISKDELFVKPEVTSTAADNYLKDCHRYLNVPLQEVLSAFKGKTLLNLSGFRPNGLNFYFICQGLIGPPVSRVTHIDFSNNPIEVESCVTLSSLLKNSFTLVSLNLRNCQFGFRGVEYLAEGISLSPSLLTLNLSKCNLKDDGGVVVSQALGNNEVLKHLDLSENHLHVKTADEISKMLAINRTLKTLNLSWNDFYPERESSVKLLRGLQRNASIMSIDFSWNGFRGRLFSRTLMTVMRSNNVIKNISLRRNYLSNIELENICQGIKRSRSTKELNLEGNRFSIEDMKKLIDAVTTSSTVTSLILGHDVYLTKELAEKASTFNETVLVKDPAAKGIVFHGQILPNPPKPINFENILLDRAKYLAMRPKKKKLRRNMGHLFLNLAEASEDHMTSHDFLHSLKTFKARLDDDLKNSLVQEFTERAAIGNEKKLRKLVASKKMAEAYLARHPTDPPPPPKPKKRRKRKKRKGGKGR